MNRLILLLLISGVLFSLKVANGEDIPFEHIIGESESTDNPSYCKAYYASEDSGSPSCVTAFSSDTETTVIPSIIRKNVTVERRPKFPQSTNVYGLFGVVILTINQNFVLKYPSDRLP